MDRSNSMEQINRQLAVEEQYNKRHIDRKIRLEMEAHPLMIQKVEEGVALLNEWLSRNFFPSKNTRLEQVKAMDLKALVLDLLVGVAYCQEAELFTSVTAQLASRLDFSDKPEAIQTVAELLAVLCLTDAFDIGKASRGGSLMVISRIPLSADLVKFIEGSRYLPPMVCEPLELEDNYSSGYLTHKDSLILGKGNHHNGDLCLDVLNQINRIPLQLNTEFLSQVEEDPSKEFTIEWAKKKAAEKGQDITEAEARERVRKAIEHWHRFKGQCYEFYLLVAQYGNRFYLTHKVDKRGRIYCGGYHITTQGTAFKKASIELADEALVTGVPTTF